jgi:translation initiation factor IF-2
MRKMGGGNYPPSLDVLVQGRFLRKKYKDPMTADGEWDVILAAGGVPGQGGSAPQQPGIGRQGAPSTGLSAPPSRNSAPSPSPFAGGQGAGGGIMGVRSKSKESSFRLYKGTGTHYNEWLFLFSAVSNRPGAPGGQAAPGLPGRGNQMPGIGPGIGPGRGPGRGPGTGPGPDGGRGPRGFGPGTVQPGMRRGGGS